MRGYSEVIMEEVEGGLPTGDTRGVMSSSIPGESNVLLMTCSPFRRHIRQEKREFSHPACFFPDLTNLGWFPQFCGHNWVI